MRVVIRCHERKRLVGQWSNTQYKSLRAGDLKPLWWPPDTLVGVGRIRKTHETFKQERRAYVYSDRPR